MPQILTYWMTRLFLFSLFALAFNLNQVSALTRHNGNKGGRYNSWHGRSYYYGYYGGPTYYGWPGYYAYYGGPAYRIYPYLSSYYYTAPSYSVNYSYPSYPYQGYYYKNNAIIMPANPSADNRRGTGVFYNSY